MVLSAPLCQILQPWHWYGSRFSDLICLNRPYVVGSLLDQIGSIFSLACLVYRSRSVKSSRSVELPMIENVWGYSRNPCSLNRERDAALLPSSSCCRQGSFRQRNLRSGWRVRQYKLTTWLRQGWRRAISQWIAWFYRGFRHRSRRRRSRSEKLTQRLVPYSENKGYASNPRRFVYLKL